MKCICRIGKWGYNESTHNLEAKTLLEMDFPEGNPPHSHLGLDFSWDNIMSHLNYPSFLPGELIHHLRAKAKGMIITQ